jgi:bacterioferritin
MRQNEFDYQYYSSEPYPPITVEKPNKNYAMLILDDYAGLTSEMTAINQYIYHDFTINKKNPDIAKVIERISLNEMRHLEVLAELIIALGEKPIFYSQSGYWNGDYVDYGENLLDKLVIDLNSEKEAISKYQRHIALIDDKNIKAILARIILDEEVHVKIFTDLIEKVSKK